MPGRPQQMPRASTAPRCCKNWTRAAARAVDPSTHDIPNPSVCRSNQLAVRGDASSMMACGESTDGQGRNGAIEPAVDCTRDVATVVERRSTSWDSVDDCPDERWMAGGGRRRSESLRKRVRFRAGRWKPAKRLFLLVNSPTALTLTWRGICGRASEPYRGCNAIWR
jgi:hypothetical protein